MRIAIKTRDDYYMYWSITREKIKNDDTSYKHDILVINGKDYHVNSTGLVQGEGN